VSEEKVRKRGGNEWGAHENSSRLMKNNVSPRGTAPGTAHKTEEAHNKKPWSGRNLRKTLLSDTGSAQVLENKKGRWKGGSGKINPSKGRVK